VSGAFPTPPGGKWLFIYETTATESLLNVAAAQASVTDDQGAQINGVPNPFDSDTTRIVVDP